MHCKYMIVINANKASREMFGNAALSCDAMMLEVDRPAGCLPLRYKIKISLRGDQKQRFVNLCKPLQMWPVMQ